MEIEKHIVYGITVQGVYYLVIWYIIITLRGKYLKADNLPNNHVKYIMIMEMDNTVIKITSEIRLHVTSIIEKDQPVCGHTNANGIFLITYHLCTYFITLTRERKY